jgi:hypothetical protein
MTATIRPRKTAVLHQRRLLFWILAALEAAAWAWSPSSTHSLLCRNSFMSTTTKPTRVWSRNPESLSVEEALARTKAHLAKLQQRQSNSNGIMNTEDQQLHPQQRQSIEQETLYRKYILQSANSLKSELQARKLTTKGRKPDLARRLAHHDIARRRSQAGEDFVVADEQEEAILPPQLAAPMMSSSCPYPVKFAGFDLSFTAAQALHQAGFLTTPSPIQAAALPALFQGDSILLHAPTGSGKTLAYLLPVTEYYCNFYDEEQQQSFAIIATPTRELAAQVAGVASTLAPPGRVRLISHPSNLMTDGSKETSQRSSASGRPASIIVGSAKAIVSSLYGNEDYPASPTPKPLALQLLKNVRYLVLDEVDRLLAVSGKFNEKKKKHDKPAAILAAAVARHSLGRAQIVAASATVGRPLKRELARVLGLPPPEGPRVVVAQEGINTNTGDGGEDSTRQQQGGQRKRKKTSTTTVTPATTRAVTIPDTVQHYLAAVRPPNNNNNDSASSTSTGQLLIRAYQVIQSTVAQNPTARILFVLTRGFGISTQHVIGALTHFNCQPTPVSLLDALQENVEGTDELVQVHRQVSGATGLGQSLSSSSDEPSSSSPQQDNDNENKSSSLWVTGEDTIRGLHLDGLDVVIVVGRPRGPDEYTHIAGRTGRAGRSGQVVTVVAHEQAPLIRAWETMLQVSWHDYK